MKIARLAPAALLLVTLAAAADSSADQNAKASATAKPRVVIPPWPDSAKLPAFDADAFPEDKSKAPSADEWKGAAEVRLSSTPPGITSCRSYRVREWMKVHCERRTAMLRLVAGSADGVALFTTDGVGDKESGGFWETMGKFGEVIFPVRRGDRRVFEWIDFDFGFYEGWGVDSAFLIEESWVEGAKNPEIALRLR